MTNDEREAISPEDWARLRNAIRPDADLHPIDLAQLGEYAVLLTQRGPRPAERAFPSVARHLATGCAACRVHLRELLAFAEIEVRRSQSRGAIDRWGRAAFNSPSLSQSLSDHPISDLFKAEADSKPQIPEIPLSARTTSDVTSVRSILPTRAAVLVTMDTSVEDVVTGVLAHFGFSVRSANTGEAALSLVRADATDLIFLEMPLPDTNLQNFVRAYRLLEGRITPVVVLAPTEEMGPSDSRIEGVDYLAKPIDLFQLFETLQRHSRFE